MKKIGIYFETNYYLVETTKELYCQDIYTNLFNKFNAQNFEIHILGKSTIVNNSKFYKFKIPVKFHQIPFYNTLVSFFSNTPSFFLDTKRIVDEFVKECNMILVMTPSPIANYILYKARKSNKDYNILVRQNSYEMIPNRFKGFKKEIAKVFTFLLENWVERFSRNNQSKVIAVGDETFKRYSDLSKNTINFASSKYEIKDIVKVDIIESIDWSGVIKILYVGGLEVNKGLRELLDAINHLEHYNLELSLVGDGSLFEEIKDYILENNLSEKVFIKGYLKYGVELLEIYESNDILILPSYSEGLPQVLLEGMAKGCLILATSVGGIPSIVDHSKTGFLFKPFSSEEIKKTISFLIDNQVDSKQICLKALETAKKYSFENQFNILMSQLETSGINVNN